MDSELRHLQRIAYEQPNSDWARYCRALERAYGVSSPEPINYSTLETMIYMAGTHQKLTKEWSKTIITRMVANGTEFFDFDVSPDLRIALDAIPRGEDNPDRDDTGVVYRITLKETYGKKEHYLAISRLQGFGRTYTADSTDIGGTQRFYTILKALIEETAS